MRNYESVVIFRPDIDEERKAASLDKFKAIIEADGEIVSVDEWGLKKLAYEIMKFKDGFYYLITFKSSSELPKELERNFRISDDVIRFMVVSKEQ